jgi:hypothetical protein
MNSCTKVENLIDKIQEDNKLSEINLKHDKPQNMEEVKATLRRREMCSQIFALYLLKDFKLNNLIARHED